MLLKSQISKVFFNYANENSTGIKRIWKIAEKFLTLPEI